MSITGSPIALGLELQGFRSLGFEEIRTSGLLDLRIRGLGRFLGGPFITRGTLFPTIRF